MVGQVVDCIHDRSKYVGLECQSRKGGIIQSSQYDGSLVIEVLLDQLPDDFSILFGLIWSCIFQY